MGCLSLQARERKREQLSEETGPGEKAYVYTLWEFKEMYIDFSAISQALSHMLFSLFHTKPCKEGISTPFFK